MFSTWGDVDRSFLALEDFRRRMDRALHDLDGRASEREWPPTNVFDVGEQFVLQLEVPGLTEKELDLTLLHDVLTIRGERKTEVPAGHAVHRQERAPFKFARGFQFGSKLDPERVLAELKDGLLTVTLHKSPEAQPRAIAVRSS